MQAVDLAVHRDALAGRKCDVTGRAVTLAEPTLDAPVRRERAGKRGGGRRGKRARRVRQGGQGEEGMKVIPGPE